MLLRLISWLQVLSLLCFFQCAFAAPRLNGVWKIAGGEVGSVATLTSCGQGYEIHFPDSATAFLMRSHGGSLDSAILYPIEETLDGYVVGYEPAGQLSVLTYYGGVVTIDGILYGGTVPQFWAGTLAHPLNAVICYFNKP